MPHCINFYIIYCQDIFNHNLCSVNHGAINADLFIDQHNTAHLMSAGEMGWVMSSCLLNPLPPLHSTTVFQKSIFCSYDLPPKVCSCNVTKNLNCLMPIYYMYQWCTGEALEVLPELQHSGSAAFSSPAFITGAKYPIYQSISCKMRRHSFGQSASFDTEANLHTS